MSRIKFTVPKCACGRLAVAVVEGVPADRKDFAKVPRCLPCAKEFKRLADERQKEIDKTYDDLFKSAVPVVCDCGFRLGIRKEDLDEISAGVWGTIACPKCKARLNDKIKTLTRPGPSR